MARGHLFLIVVLLAGAAVAGLLAVSRTSASTTPSTNPDSAIAYRLQKLDRFEADLRRQLARRSATPSHTAPVLEYRRAPAQVLVTRQHEDDESEAYESHSEERDD